MTAIPARRRRRMIAAVVTSGLSVIALPGGLFLGTNSLLHASGGNSIDSRGTVDIPSSVVEMLAVINSRNEVASLALIAVTPEGKGGTIVSIPVGSMADVAKTEQPHRIADSYTAGGLQALRTDVENLMNITVDFSDDVTATEFAAVLTSVGTQPVVLQQPVTDTGIDGTATVVLEAGSSTATPDLLAAGLASSQPGTPESARLPQVKALWNSIARAGVATPTAEVDGSTSSISPIEVSAFQSTAAFMKALLMGEIDVWQFSSTLFTDAVRNPNNADLYGLDTGEILMVMASVVPSALTVTSVNVAVMVDIPFASAVVAKEVVTRLAFLGANVVLIRQSPDLATERTTVFYNDSIARTEAEAYPTLLGPLEFTESKDVISGVNLRIVLGNDFVAFLGQGSATSTSTTSTTEPK
ncbi:MAG: hypothetical protein CK521_01620 [Acidimicrobium sp.]|nr:MAG: hypothetical protein CK521_01620 [Acidimicrobium sp.]